jgi:Fe-Mn family superoxide dismutase
MVVKTTPNAGTPLTVDGEHPLLVIDLWEHAWLYCPEYAADKLSYLEAVWKQLNWNFINDNYATK